MAHTLRGDLILQMRELELVCKTDFIKWKFLIFNDCEMFITITLQIVFQESSSGFFIG